MTPKAKAATGTAAAVAVAVGVWVGTSILPVRPGNESYTSPAIEAPAPAEAVPAPPPAPDRVRVADAEAPAVTSAAVTDAMRRRAVVRDPVPPPPEPPKIDATGPALITINRPPSWRIAETYTVSINGRVVASKVAGREAAVEIPIPHLTAAQLNRSGFRIDSSAGDVLIVAPQVTINVRP